MEIVLFTAMMATFFKIKNDTSDGNLLSVKVSMDSIGASAGLFDYYLENIDLMKEGLSEDNGVV